MFRIGGKGGKRGIAAYHLTEIVDVIQFVQGHQLDADIAQRRGLYGPGNHRDAAGVGAQLIKQRVLAAAADNMQLAERLAAELGQFAEYAGVEQGQAVENTARQFGVIAGNRLPGLATGGLNFGAHIGRIDKAFVVAVNDETAGRKRSGTGDQRRQVADVLFFQHPL